MSNREQRQIELAVEALDAILLQAVQETITDARPDPARETVGELIELDERHGSVDNRGTGRLVAVLSLAAWLGAVREELADQPQRVDEVLDWIEESLGRRYRARARYTSGPLMSESAADEIADYMDALGDDFIPSLIWLLAGAVARYGDGDVAWLRRLRGAPA